MTQNSQEIIERDVRMQIGDLTLQVIVARSQVAELQAMNAALQQKVLELGPQVEVEPAKANGKDKGKTDGQGSSHQPN